MTLQGFAAFLFLRIVDSHVIENLASIALDLNLVPFKVTRTYCHQIRFEYINLYNEKQLPTSVTSDLNAFFVDHFFLNPFFPKPFRKP